MLTALTEANCIEAEGHKGYIIYIVFVLNIDLSKDDMTLLVPTRISLLRRYFQLEDLVMQG